MKDQLPQLGWLVVRAVVGTLRWHHFFYAWGRATTGIRWYPGPFLAHGLLIFHQISIHQVIEVGRVLHEAPVVQ